MKILLKSLLLAVSLAFMSTNASANYVDYLVPSKPGNVWLALTANAYGEAYFCVDWGAYHQCATVKAPSKTNVVVGFNHYDSKSYHFAAYTPSTYTSSILKRTLNNNSQVISVVQQPAPPMINYKQDVCTINVNC
jgi:hypothetical protein